MDANKIVVGKKYLLIGGPGGEAVKYNPILRRIGTVVTVLDSPMGVSAERMHVAIDVRMTGDKFWRVFCFELAEIEPKGFGKWFKEHGNV